MDPYLESPEYWPSFHHHLAEELMTQLNVSLGPAYYADVEVRASLDDLNILTTVQVRQTGTNTLVTAIELLSPINKHGCGLEQYRQKRERMLTSSCHLVEIDLLRRSQRAAWEVEDPPLAADYIVLVNRARPDNLRVSEIWPVALSAPLPTMPVPLLPPDPDVMLDIADALRQIYTRARYARRIDYRAAPPPPDLSPEDAAWVDDHLRERGLRS
jgi:hypothetical protein